MCIFRVREASRLVHGKDKLGDGYKGKLDTDVHEKSIGKDKPKSMRDLRKPKLANHPNLLLSSPIKAQDSDDDPIDLFS